MPLYILNKVDIWTGVTDALLTDWLTDRLSLNVKKLFDLVPHFNCWWWLTVNNRKLKINQVLEIRPQQLIFNNEKGGRVLNVTLSTRSHRVLKIGNCQQLPEVTRASGELGQTGSYCLHRFPFLGHASCWKVLIPIKYCPMGSNFTCELYNSLLHWSIYYRERFFMFDFLRYLI